MSSKSEPAVATPAAAPAGVEDMYPLSPMQEGMLYETLYAPGSGVYVTQVESVLEGDLDLALLENCWRRVVERHPILRTFFVWGDLRQWAQVVERAAELPIAVVDLGGVDEGGQERAIAERRERERADGFDLGRAPLARLVLLRRRADLHVSLWTFHHLLLDGWSVAIVLAEVYEAYAAALEGREPVLLPRPRYRDYVAWLKRQDRAAAEAFWRAELAGVGAPTPLPFGRPRGGEGGVRAQQAVRRKLSPAASEALTAWARRHRLTVNTVLQGAWGLVLARCSGEPTVVFGTGVSGRPAELEGADRMVGLFVNTIPVRVDCPRAAEVVPWLAALQARQLEARRFEWVPLVDVRGWSEIGGGQPLFEAGLNFENFPSAMVEVSGEEVEGDLLRLRQVTSYDQTDVPWTLGARPGRQLALRLDYAADRFDAATAERALGHVETVLAAFVAGARRLADVPLLAAEERRAWLVDWQGEWTRPDDPEPEPVVLLHRQVEAVAARLPDALAAVSGEHELSYRDLDRRASRLARHLRRLGAGPETRVGLYLERHRPEVLVALLAVLKAGAAYVALDPDYPRLRLRTMAAAAGLSLVLSRRGLAAEVPAEGARVVALDDDAAWADLPSTPLADDPPPAAQVYVVFTSGSSGEPKGVVSEHASLARRVDFLRGLYEFEPGDRLLQFVSLSFDASIEEIFPLLTAGATLVQHPAASELTPAELLEVVERFAVDSLHLPPAYWHALVDHLVDADLPVPPRVSRFITGGEAPSLPRVAEWARRGDDPRRDRPLRMWNGYGPTEATFGCTTYEVPLAAAALAGEERLSIGRPWPHNRMYVRGADLEALPAGVPGELHCGSTILTRGYLDDPRRTAERFLPDPDSPRPGARMYRTGDRGRFRADGRLDFLGRVDAQVKVRGVRVEPAEVEAALAEHPRVAAAAVVVHGEGERRALVAYVVGRDGAPPAGEALREHLLDRLPPAMVPAFYLPLAELPLSPNGKVDHRSLPEPGAVLDAPRRAVPAETESERALVEIWRRVLGEGGGPVGVTDDFFLLGGNSLLAVRLVAQVEKRFGRRLPLATLLEKRTVRRLAALLDEPAGALPWRPLVALETSGETPPLFCVHPVGGEVLCYQPLAARLAGERQVYGLQAPGLRETTASPSVEALARGYLDAIREAQPEGPYHLLGWSFGAFVAYEMARLLSAAGEEVGGLYLLDTWAPLFEAPPEDEDLQMLVDLARDRARQSGREVPVLPLAELARLGEEERLDRFLGCLKQQGLIPDDVSVALARDILRGYRARRRAVEAYRPQPYEGEVTLLLAGEPEDPQHRELLARVGLDPDDRTLGWGRLSARPVETFTVAGNHETLCAEPHVGSLADALRRALDARSVAVAAVDTQQAMRS